MNWTHEHKAILKRLIVEAEDALGSTAAYPYTIRLLEALQQVEQQELRCRASLA